ncbi:ABC transporter ATP-binding protein [Nostocoides vanveenii]|jgi:NitT/TauT family transport system ATP-binding protein|uniref:ABC transporter ATP-binding protein n=1 Tax=Nostocoides vanveenii TaxID=330835 RepID=A0ABN2KSZ8_9MICO
MTALAVPDARADDPFGINAFREEGGSDNAVVLDEVTKRYGRGTLALDGIDLRVRRGEFVCFVGASGCGKSTLLNIVSGLDKATSGRVSVAGRPALMFQEHALMPWLSSLDNVALPMRLAGVPKAQRLERAHELLASVHLGDVVDKRPHELSGGMRQRVALARTLATESQVLLMDEPFGALDAMTRDLLHDELESVWRARGLTVLFVTHNVREAVRLADRVVLLSSRPGRVVQEYPIELARPRRFDDPAVGSATGQITTALRKEVARHGD